MATRYDSVAEATNNARKWFMELTADKPVAGVTVERKRNGRRRVKIHATAKAKPERQVLNETHVISKPNCGGYETDQTLREHRTKSRQAEVRTIPTTGYQYDRKWKPEDRTRATVTKLYHEVQPEHPETEKERQDRIVQEGLESMKLEQAEYKYLDEKDKAIMTIGGNVPFEKSGKKISDLPSWMK